MSAENRSSGSGGEDPKEKFRSALERKRARQGTGASAGGPGRSKVAGEHGAEGGKRTFRRKSGG